MTDRLPGSLRAWEELLRGAASVDIFLDCDGTLAPLVPRPEQARIPASTLERLAALAACPGVAVTVVSGRSLMDLRRLVPLAGVALAGNHGLEINAGDGSEPWLHPRAREWRPLLGEVVSRLITALAEVPGAWVEDKGLTLSVHHRRVPRPAIPAVRATVERVLSSGCFQESLILRPGKEVLEIRPKVVWDKGCAALFLLERRHGPGWAGRTLPVAVGDDTTDEDMFVALAGPGLTVHVGAGATAAACRLPSPEAVAGLLGFILRCRLTGEAPSRIPGGRIG